MSKNPYCFTISSAIFLGQAVADILCYEPCWELINPCLFLDYKTATINSNIDELFMSVIVLLRVDNLV